MISKLYLWLGSIAAVILAIIGIRTHAKSQGKQEARQQQQQKVVENVKEAKQVKDDIARIDDDSVRRRLRERIKRK